jgi:hypothetical protein
MNAAITRAALALGLAVVIAGCGSSTTPVNAPTTSPLRGGLSTAGITIQNNSSRCAWMTSYWSYTLDSTWHIAVGDGANPRLLRPHEIWEFKIDYNNPVAGSQETRVQAEFFGPGGGCQGSGPKITATVRGYSPVGDFYIGGQMHDTDNGKLRISLCVLNDYGTCDEATSTRRKRLAGTSPS